MKINLERMYYEDRTMGRLYLPNISTAFYTIERPWLNNKPFKSCIPEGIYNCSSYTSERFPDVWEVLAVPNRTHILIHVGNYVTDVVGCIAVGTTCSKTAVYNSKLALDYMRDALDPEFELYITEADKEDSK